MRRNLACMFTPLAPPGQQLHLEAVTPASVDGARRRRRPGRLKARRLILGFTQEDVAARVPQSGLTRDGLSRIENGHVWPQPRCIFALARLYGASPGQICEEILEAWEVVHGR